MALNPDWLSNAMRPARVAGSILVWVAVGGYLLYGALSPVAFLLGTALCVIEESSKLEIARLLVFVWCAVSLLVALPGVFAGDDWVGLLRSCLLSGSVGALMLEGLKESTVGILAVVGWGAVLF